MTTPLHIGIDAGGTLVKIASGRPGEEIQLAMFPASDLPAAAGRVRSHPGSRVCATGGKAALFRSMIGESQWIAEFDATCAGAKHLLAQEDRLLRSFLLTNVGTGTSIHYVSEGEHERIGGTGVGGGTLLGLSALAGGVAAYDDIVKLASTGSRDMIDLKVSHIYEGATPPIPGELTASNFGRWLQTGGSARREDVLAAVTGLVGETVASISVHAAAQCSVSSVVYIGSSFIRNDLLRQVVIGYTRLRGSDPYMLRNGEFSGAIGALLALRDDR